MKLKIILLVLLLSFVINGCAVKTANIQKDLNIYTILDFIKQSNPSLCSYRGRTAVTVETDRKITFSTLINKKCSDDTLINILGAFNNPVAEIKYWNKEVTIKTPSNENTDALKQIADETLFHVISFLKSPYIIPNANEYTLSYSKDAYVFTDTNGNKILADENFKLIKYIQGSVIAEYEWEEDFIKSITVSSNNIKLKIKFFTKNGWGGEKNNG